jgi:hypothetical protein
MTSEINRCYRALELESGASLEQVKQAWRDLVKVWHPDRFPNDAKLQRKAQERLKDINCAYEILEQYLTSSTPPPHSRSSTSQTANPRQQQRSEPRASESKHTQTPPPKPPPPPSSSQQTKRVAKESQGVVAWAVVGGIVVLLLILANSGDNFGRSSSSGSSSFGTPPRDGGSGFTPLPPETHVSTPVSKTLDEKNGFKDFKFGMTPHEAREVLPPSTVTELPGANAIVFHYRKTPANWIGEFSTDNLSLTFFDGRLYRIEVNFTGFQNEILEACKANYGEPMDTDDWTRGDLKLKGKSWRGEKVDAVLLCLPSQAWDSLIIYEIGVERE